MPAIAAKAFRRDALDGTFFGPEDPGASPQRERALQQLHLPAIRTSGCDLDHHAEAGVVLEGGDGIAGGNRQRWNRDDMPRAGRIEARLIDRADVSTPVDVHHAHVSPSSTRVAVS